MKDYTVYPAVEVPAKTAPASCGKPSGRLVKMTGYNYNAAVRLIKQKRCSSLNMGYFIKYFLQAFR